MNFNEYVSDILGLHQSLMSREEIEAARRDYDNLQPAKAAHRPLSQKAREFRDDAKFFGGKALLGSRKQKEWAEKIRAEKLRGMSEEQAIFACDPDGLGKHSKFWIENRERSGNEIGGFFEKQKALLAKAMELREELKQEEYALVAAEYNALSAEWGFQ